MLYFLIYIYILYFISFVLYFILLQTKVLGRLGGPTLKEVVKQLMYRLFTNSLGMEYSWEGKKKKKPFKSLLITSVILG